MSRQYYGGGGAGGDYSSASRGYSPSPPPTYRSAQGAPAARGHPAAHPDSAYNRMRENRYSGYYQDQEEPSYPPAPPPHSSRQQQRNAAGRRIGQSQSTRTNSTVTPGADNLGGAAVGGGIAGVAVGVAGSHERESGANAMNGYRYEDTEGMYNGPAERGGMYGNTTSDNPYVPPPPETAGNRFDAHDDPSHAPVGATTGPLLPPEERTGFGSANRSNPDFQDGPYQRQTMLGGPDPTHINPNDIVDDGDDGFPPDTHRRSLLSVGRDSSHNNLPANAGVAGGAAGASTGMLAASSHGSGGPDDPSSGPAMEKGPWLDEQRQRKKRLAWIIGIVIALVIIGGVVGGVLGAVLPNQKNGGGSSDKSLPGPEVQNADEDEEVNGDLHKDSEQIKALMDNPDVHKVFPGVDYTPWGTQYPDCLTYPPSQNNVTRDMAMLSQMTNTLRLYGTDCNQTEMTIHAINQLELTDMKLWLGVWIDTNTTTNDRQLKQLYKILDEAEDTSLFKGVIVGNEFLFRGSQTQSAMKTLTEKITSVREKLKDNGFKLPVGTSDLGDAWTEGLAKEVDVVMANVHPFFGGLPVEQATGWTWSFWTEHNVPLTEGTDKENIVAEVGWPTGGGSNCSPLDKCPDDESGAIAGIEELNIFMEDWICPSLKNGTNYFWFEAFDEPWKQSFNEPGKSWEDKWGLMTPDRKLKPGLKIPDCGDLTI